MLAPVIATMRKQVFRLGLQAVEKALEGVSIVMRRPVLIVVEVWPAIVATTLAANYRQRVFGFRGRQEFSDMAAAVAGLSLALTVAYTCTAVFGIIVAGDRQLPLRGAWEVVRGRLWVFALIAVPAALAQVEAHDAAADESRAYFAVVNGAAVAIQLALLVSVPLLVVGVRKGRRESMRDTVARYVVTASVSLAVSAADIALSGLGRALTKTKLLSWLGVATVIASLLLYIVAIAGLRAVRSGASLDVTNARHGAP
jgi:hypothetical protein